MCLFPGFSQSMQPIVPPTMNGEKHKRILFWVMLAHLAISILLMFVDIKRGISELMLVLILWCANSQMSHCSLIFYMVYCLYRCIQTFCDFGFWI